MKNIERLLYGIIITIIIFTISTFIGSKFHLSIKFIPYSFVTHFLMLVLSFCSIYGLRRYVKFKIALPVLKKTLKPILFGLIASIVINISLTIRLKSFGGKLDAHPALAKMSSLQIFIFAFIFASIAEEILFRGFLLNFLKPLNIKGITFLKRNISIPVIISGIAFGLGHLILITSGVGILFLIRIVVFTTVLGIIAGYYQEKHNNTAYAILVHMAGNLMVVIVAFLMSLNA